jgi:hypothetical protein
MSSGETQRDPVDDGRDGPSRKAGGDWIGEAGIGSGHTGGDHLAYNVALLGVILGVGCAVGADLVRRPLWMLGWLAPVFVLALCAIVAKKRNRPAYLICVFLTAVAGLFAMMASCTPAPIDEDDRPMSRPSVGWKSSK